MAHEITIIKREKQVFSVFSDENLPFTKIYINFAAQNRAFPTSKGPDGGIGRRAGLKHQWGNPCRFDPGSGYFYKNQIPCKSLIYKVFLFSGVLKRC